MKAHRTNAWQVCMILIQRKAADIDTLISSPRPNKWRQTNFTFTDSLRRHNELRPLKAAALKHKEHEWGVFGRQVSRQTQGWSYIPWVCSARPQTSPPSLFFLVFSLFLRADSVGRAFPLNTSYLWDRALQQKLSQDEWLLLRHVSCFCGFFFFPVRVTPPKGACQVACRPSLALTRTVWDVASPAGRDPVWYAESVWEYKISAARHSSRYRMYSACFVSGLEFRGK